MSLILRVGDKPLDIGHDGIMGSVNQAGRIIALSAYHGEHGIVTMTSAPPFPDDARYDGGHVRAFRRGLVILDGFGVRLVHRVAQTKVRFMDDGAVGMTMMLDDGTVADCMLEVVAPWGMVQTWRFDRETSISFDGDVWLQRHAYAQLTEGGILPAVSVMTSTFDVPDGIGLANLELGWAVSLMGIPCKGIAHEDGHVDIKSEAMSSEGVQLIFGLGQDAESAITACERLRAHQHIASAEIVTEDWIEARAYYYGRLCCVPVNEESTCILTDHMLLPLSWNRDAYYMARLLLCDEASWATVRGHLVWMFETAERINGLWGRSYLANGRIKDRGFQLDQQLFPLLELAEYVRLSGDDGLMARLKPAIVPIFEALEVHRAPHALLYATDETPADDPIDYPYPLSSHILLWYTLKQLTLVGCDDVTHLTPEAIADSIARYFVATRPNSITPLYAYATDGQGRHHFYHDANDMPLAFMPVWGFCNPHDALWRATVDFAFSDANKGGFYKMALGSVHTRAPWALGDVQAWVIARAMGDEDGEKQALARLQSSAQWDGALSEAYDGATGAVVSRHWFLWTNAVYACIKQGVFDL